MRGEARPVEKELAPMSDTGLTPMPEPPRRMEIFTGAGRRRVWSPEEKAAILAECEHAGETVSGVARRHGLTASQLFWWRRTAREAAKREGTRSNSTAFAPVVVTPEAALNTGPHGDGTIEIVLGGAIVR